MKTDIGLLASGNLGNIALNFLEKATDVNLKFVLTDKKSDEIKENCHQKSISFFAGNPRKNKNRVDEILADNSIDLLFSVNYLFIVDKDIIEHPKHYAINLHGSLLPKYRGRTPHVWAIINGEKETGVTAHLMEAECDSGMIVEQVKIPVEDEDTGAVILEKFNSVYPYILNKIIQQSKHNKLTFNPQDSSKATYFGKRTPDDGKINWNWQKERIRNWIRAQAHPYPGAFTFLNDKKIIIDEISYSDYGFTDEESNGTVVKVINKKPYIKTPNGVVILEKLREEEIIFQNNMLLG